MKKAHITSFGRVAIIIGELAVIMAGCGHSETADMEPEHTATVDAIVQEFLDNEEEAKAKYVDKVVAISGPVFEVDKTDGKITAVKLSSDEFAIASFTLQEGVEDISDEEVTIKGVCSGFMGDTESMLPGGTVELKRGAIIQEESK